MIGKVEFIYAGHYCSERQTAYHSHNGAELVLVTAGGCETEFEGRKIIASPGIVYVTPPGMMHRQTNLSGICETYYTVVKAEQYFPRFALRTIDTRNDMLTAQWFRDLFELYKSGCNEEAELLLQVILARLDGFDNRTGFPAALLRAVEYLEKNCTAKITVAELARCSAVSQSHLNMLFRKYTGRGPAQYLLNVRMLLAKRLLCDMYYTITEVGELSGFGDINYFSRVFRRFYGMSPGKYREKFIDGKGDE